MSILFDKELEKPLLKDFKWNKALFKERAWGHANYMAVKQHLVNYKGDGIKTKQDEGGAGSSQREIDEKFQISTCIGVNYIDVAGGVSDPLKATVRQWLKTEKNRANIFSDKVQECAVAVVLSEGGG